MAARALWQEQRSSVARALRTSRRVARNRWLALPPPLTPVGAAQILEGGIEAYSGVDPSVPKYAKYTPNFKF